MERTPIDQLLAPPLDAELKRYTVLAQVQRARRGFGERKLYPHLSGLQHCVEALQALQRERQRIDAARAREVEGIDLQQARMVYGAPSAAHELSLIDEVVDHALPAFTTARNIGNELRHELARTIRFEPVGLLPLDTAEGYLLLRQEREARAYAYTLHQVELPNGQAQAHLTTRYVSTYTLGLVCTYEHIKLELVRAYHLPNPATFAFEAAVALPAVETYLPLAKQLMVAVLRKGVV